MQKILIISENKSLRGGYKAAVELGNALKTPSFNNVKFFTEMDAKKEKITLLKIKLFKLINKFIKLTFVNNNNITNTLPQIFKFYNHKKLSCDIILINVIYEFLSIKDIILFRKPTLIFIHDMWFMGGVKHFFDKSLLKKNIKINSLNFYEFFNFIAWRFKMKFLSLNKKLIFVASSNWLKEQATSSLMLKNHRIEKIHTPANTLFWKKLNKKESRKKLNLPLNKKLILFVAKGGLKNFRKGGDIFSKIVSNFKNKDKINFIVLGQSVPKNEKISKNLYFLSFNDDEKKLRYLYNSSDLTVCLSRYENIPYSMIESMSCGVPCISFDVGGINEIISHKKNGWLLKNQNMNHIKNSIKWCLNNKNHIKLSKNSTLHVKKEFSYAKIIKDYNKLNKTIGNYEIN